MFSALELKIVCGVAALAAAMVMFGLYSAHQRELGAEQQIAIQTANALAAEQEARRESERRATAIQGVANDADQAASAARADADAARSAGDRLRLRLAAAERGRSAGDPTAAAAGEAASAPGLVPYDVFERVRIAGEQLAAFADQSRIAGRACEAAYEGLTP